MMVHLMPMSVVDGPRDGPQRRTGAISAAGSQVVGGDADARYDRTFFDGQNEKRRPAAVISVKQQRVGQRSPEVERQGRVGTAVPAW